MPQPNPSTTASERRVFRPAVDARCGRGAATGIRPHVDGRVATPADEDAKRFAQGETPGTR